MGRQTVVPVNPCTLVARSSCCALASTVILFLYSAEHSCREWAISRGRLPASGGYTGTWRVVFSSTGDLTPARDAVRECKRRSRTWIDAARRPLRMAVDGFAALLLPSDCRICNQPLIQLSRIPVCDECVNSLSPTDVNACSICGEALDVCAVGVPSLCAVCRRVPPRFDFAVSFGSYDGALRKLVHLLKYEQLRPAANLLGAKLAEAISARKISSERPIVTIPVPLHRTKRRQRGFNQTELIARTALRHLERSGFELRTRILRRVRATVSQTGLTRHQRRENVRGAFLVRRPEHVRDRSVLIVDDVYTTGTTLNECARVLRAAGATQVVVATVARVYRSVVEIMPGTMLNQEERPAALTRAAAG